MSTITKRGNAYQIRVSTGYDGNGKQVKKNMTWTPPVGMKPDKIKKELDTQAILFEESVKINRSLNGNIKFSVFAEKWMKNHVEGHLAPKTNERYSELLVRINKSFGHIALDNLQPSHLMDFYSNLAEAGVKDSVRFKVKDLARLMEEHSLRNIDLARLSGIAPNTIREACKGNPVTGKTLQKLSGALETKQSTISTKVNTDALLSSRTILHYHRLISSILETAVRWQIILSNPASRVTPPKVEKSEAKCLDEEQAKEVIALLQTAPMQYKTMVVLLIFTGIRRGELRDLRRAFCEAWRKDGAA